ncbi:Lrp/AsnC family transcriptional regulator [uncultured Shimia sp.]|uniref:Lrp/AsnC family transcriptional regulator n=1 Tax=uncultured Shimia sp. TaxID=573152 RepID=UPI0025EC1764|nr:Lrp/AsnC family transcriptional regulator [uncultured Shimia sp.]
MDDADKRILRAIQEQPELTMRELGEVTGLSHTPCWRRLKRLREDGYITEKRYVLDAQKLGFDIVAFCLVKLQLHTQESLEEFETAVEFLPEVVECYSATGDQDYILKVLALSVRDYEETIKQRLLKLPHIGSIRTSLALNEIKNTPDVPV